MALFTGKGGKVPFPRTEEELVNNAMIAGLPEDRAVEHARHQNNENVFGQGYQTDKAGNPIERGKGSASQPTMQHMQALQISQEAEARRAMTMGWHPGLAQAFDPRTAPAVRRRGPNKKPARKAAAAPSAEA